MIIVDGTSYANLSVSVSRTAEVMESENSGMMLDRSYFADKLGTYLNYDVQVAVPYDKESLYTTLYEALTDPVGYHSFTLPYNQGSVNVTGRIDSVQDSFYRTEGTKKIWRKISFTIKSSYPTKEMGLSDVIAYGMPEVPDVVSPSEGDIYQYNSGQWTQITYSDVDEVYF